MPVIVIELILVMGGVLAFAWWQLRDLDREKARREAQRKAEAPAPAPSPAPSGTPSPHDPEPPP